MMANRGSDRARKWKRFSAIALLCGGLAAACTDGPEAPLAPGATPAQISSALGTTTPILNTLIGDSIQIDRLLANGPGDANLFVGPDPTDGSASIDLPVGGPGVFIDWENLASRVDQHRVLDLNDPTGKDPSSFPHSNECVASSSVLSKMDITYVAAANNEAFVYFAVQRADNNGDAGYYWLLTRHRPKQLAEAPCSDGESRLVYDISGPDPITGQGGDVLLVGHFQPSRVALLQVYQAKTDRAHVAATAAINFADTSLWALHPAGVAAVAVNTTVTAPGTFGKAGVQALDSSGNVLPEIFAEAAVPLSVFTGGNGISSCGASFYGTVITRSSGSGGPKPDLKDLSGPALFNFGTASAAATLEATCDGTVEFALTSAQGPDGNPVASPSCTWTFDDGTTVSGCSGSVALPPGTYTGSVAVVDPASGCAVTTEAGPVEVIAPLAVTPLVSANACAPEIAYDASVTGGSTAGFSYAWSFTGEGPAAPTASSNTPSGTLTVGTSGMWWTATLEVTDLGSGCSASDSATARPFAGPRVEAELVAGCGLAATYEVTAAALGDGTSIPNATCAWTFDDGSTATGCGGSLMLPAGMRSAQVTVTDPTSGCSATATAGPVAVYPSLAVTPSLTGSCDARFAYDATVTGGTPAGVSYLWTFSSPSTPSMSTAKSGTVAAGAPGSDYAATVKVTDRRTDGQLCTAVASATVTPNGPPQIAAQLVPTCDLTTNYQLTKALAANGTALASPQCAWSFDTGAASASCNGSLALPAGSHVGQLTVTDPASGCGTTFATAPVIVYPPLAIGAQLVGDCSSGLAYSATRQGGSGSVSWLWSFAGPTPTTPASSTSQSGAVTAGTSGAGYTANVVATDLRGDGLTCTASAAATATAYAPLSVSLTPVATPGTCPAMTTDAVIFNAVPSGGSGSYVYTWSNGTCTGASCTIDPDALFCDQEAISVVVADAVGSGCGAATSETETIQKVTSIVTSDN